MTTITNRQTIALIPLSPDVQMSGFMQLAAAIYCRAQRDARSKSKHIGKNESHYARAFLANDPLAASIAEVNDCEYDGAVVAGYEIERKYFIEINDPCNGGRRSLTDAYPIVVYGYIQPIRRNKCGVASVIIVEQPFAFEWRALPTDEWIALDDYAGPSGAISESEYARLLAHVPGIRADHVSIARRRAMEEKRTKNL